jgi:hypothetical protein
MVRRSPWRGNPWGTFKPCPVAVMLEPVSRRIGIFDRDRRDGAHAVKSTSTPTRIDRLTEYVFDGQPDVTFGDELRGWVDASSRFRAFVEAHRDKIRKKLRGASDPEARQDVRAELRVAQLLLADRGMDLEFEAYGVGNVGPDFTVTYRGERLFNAEVTRLHRDPRLATYGGPLLAKLRQLPPSVPNVVIVGIDGDRADAFDIESATRAMRQRADAKEDAFFTSRGLDGSRGFHARYLRLGGVIAWADAGSGDARATLWTNRSARIAVADRAIRAVLSRLRAG